MAEGYAEDCKSLHGGSIPLGLTTRGTCDRAPIPDTARQRTIRNLS